MKIFRGVRGFWLWNTKQTAGTPCALAPGGEQPGAGTGSWAARSRRAAEGHWLSNAKFYTNGGKKKEDQDSPLKGKGSHLPCCKTQTPRSESIHEAPQPSLWPHGWAETIDAPHRAAQRACGKGHVHPTGHPSHPSFKQFGVIY